MAFLGGFLGIFPIVNAPHLFGSAQTLNMIEIILDIVNCHSETLLFNILGLLLYIVPIFLVTILNKFTKINMKILSLAVDTLCIFTMWLFPIEKNILATIYLYPTFFAMSFQFCSFNGAYGFSCSTIFSTNNLRQFVSSAIELCSGDKSFALKTKFFGITLLTFHLGVAICAVLFIFFKNAAFLFALIPIVVALVLAILEKKWERL